MKNLIVMGLAAACFVSPAFAESTFVCAGQNQVAQLKISDPRTKNGSYEECNGGVGDDMTDCHSQEYQLQVQDASITFKVNGDTLYSHMELSDYGSAIDGFDIVLYKGDTIHVRLKGPKMNPVLNLELRTQGPPGNPITVGDYSLSCKEVDMKQPVYKVLREQEWKEFQSRGSFSGSKDDLKDGFIHLSPADQVDRIIKKYFSGDRPVYIAKFENAEFLKHLVWEPASDGKLYPHLYKASLSMADVESFEVRE